MTPSPTPPPKPEPPQGQQTRHLASDKPALEPVQRVTGPLDQTLPWVIELRIVGTASTIQVRVRDAMVVGRRSDNTESEPPAIDLTPHAAFSHGVSRKHAEISVNEQKLMLKDLNSTNGTRLNDLICEPYKPYRLRHGDEVMIGRLRLQVSFAVVPDEASMNTPIPIRRVKDESGVGKTPVPTASAETPPPMPIPHLSPTAPPPAANGTPTSAPPTKPGTPAHTSPNGASSGDIHNSSAANSKVSKSAPPKPNAPAPKSATGTAAPVPRAADVKRATGNAKASTPLPTAPPAPPTAVQPAPIARNMVGKGERILIIEEDENVGAVFEQSLQRAGYHATRVSTVARGLALIFEQMPDLIILDWLLPDMNGLDLVRYVRKQKTPKRVALIVVSSATAGYQMQQALNAGADMFLGKPLAVEELIKSVGKTLNE
jgi:CheY-like chemotaxis protein